MRTSSSDGNSRPTGARALAYAAAFLTAALMLSLAESFLLPAGILPVPGAKPGLANAAVLLCADIMGRRYAAAVSFCRVVVMFFLFGSATSFMYSAAGAALSFAVIALMLDIPHFSYLGQSVAAAVCHNTAQLICAACLLGPAVLSLLPYMILAGALCGAFTGFVLNLCAPAVTHAARRSFRNVK